MDRQLAREMEAEEKIEKPLKKINESKLIIYLHSLV
jgi:hypothetical protein